MQRPIGRFVSPGAARRVLWQRRALGFEILEGRRLLSVGLPSPVNANESSPIPSNDTSYLHRLSSEGPELGPELSANGLVPHIGMTPSVTNVTAMNSNGLYGIGHAIDVRVQYNEVVTVTGTPQLELETGGTDRRADYLNGSGGNTLTFRYRVQPGDVNSDLDYTNVNALSLNDGTIRDESGNDALLVLPAPGEAGSLGANRDLRIDGVPPTIVNVTSAHPNGTYGVGELIDIVVEFSEVIISVGGVPQLKLETGAEDRSASYVSRDANMLTFRYTVKAGDTSIDLDYTDSTALTAALIWDNAFNDAVLTLPVPGAAGSLGANKELVIETTPPNVTSLSPADDATDVLLGTNLEISFNENIQKGFGSIVVKQASDNATVHTIDVTTDAVTIAGAQATVTLPADLVGATRYYVVIDSGAFQDLAGNGWPGISDPAVWDFTTVPVGLLTLNIAADSVSEAAGVGATPATVTRTGDISSALLVTIAHTDDSELHLPAAVTIPATESSVQFDIETVNDGDLDGDQSGLIVAASAEGYFDATDTIDVTDDDDASDRTLGGHLYGTVASNTYRVLTDITPTKIPITRRPIPR